MRRLCLISFIAAALSFAPLDAQTLKVKLERLDPGFDDIFGDIEIEVVKQDYFGAAEGPVWMKDGAGGFLLFSDEAGNKIYKWDPVSKHLSIFADKAGFTGGKGASIDGVKVYNLGRFFFATPGPIGLAIDNEGRVIVCAMGDRTLVRIEKDGKRVTLADKFEGKRFNGPNDLAVRPDGSIYFTDVGSQLGARNSGIRGAFGVHELDFSGVFRWKPDGTVQLISRSSANGIAFSPDGKYAYTVAGGGVMRQEVRSDGTFGPATKFVDHEADGIKVDSKGFLYSSFGWVATPEGKVLGSISFPDQVFPTNVAFGDPDGRGLYFTGLPNVYRVRMKRSAW